MALIGESTFLVAEAEAEAEAVAVVAVVVVVVVVLVDAGRAGENMSSGPRDGISFESDALLGVPLNGLKAADFQGEGREGFRSSAGIVGYNRPESNVTAGEAGQTFFRVALGVPMSSSNVVLNGVRRGGVFMRDGADGDEIRRMVVVLPAFVPVLRRALDGAGIPGREGAPGIGSTVDSSTRGMPVKFIWLGRLGIEREVPTSCVASLLIAARLNPKEFAMAAFRDDLTGPMENETGING